MTKKMAFVDGISPSVVNGKSQKLHMQAETRFQEDN